MFNVETMINIFNQYKEISIFLSIAVSVLISLAGVLPSIFVTGANIIFFGPVLGFIISLLGETIGGYITFKVYRMGFKNKTKILLNKYGFWEKLQNTSGIKKWLFIFEGRLMPFIPSGIVTFACAVSEVSDTMFIIATLLGKIPSILIEAFISYDFINIDKNYVRLFLTLAGIALFWLTMKKSGKSNI